MTDRVAPASERTPRVLLSIVLAAAIARVATCFLDGPLHPDEYFQYLEPAWWHISGAGLQTWEWRDGLRSWVLPFYHGSWLVLLRALGVPDGPALTWMLKVHWALVNTALVLLAYRGGATLARRAAHEGTQAVAAGRLGGTVAAALVAGFPLLVIYAGHTLSELPSMLCLFAGLVLTAELCESHSDKSSAGAARKAALIGALLSLGACLRIANGPMVLLPSLWLLRAAGKRVFLALIAGALLPALFFALVDLLTWGKFAGSFVAYLRFNFFEGKAGQVFGSEAPSFYIEQMWRRLPWTLPLLLGAALSRPRASWPFTLSAALAVAYLSCQPHKEERFIIVVWPLLLTASGGVLGAWLERLRAARIPLFERWSVGARFTSLMLMFVACAAVFLDGAFHAGGRTWRLQARIDAQGWAGSQPELTGLLMDYPLDGAGSLWLGRTAPHLAYDALLLRNPVISHVLVASGSPAEQESLAAGFHPVHREASIVVLARRDKP